MIMEKLGNILYYALYLIFYVGTIFHSLLRVQPESVPNKFTYKPWYDYCWVTVIGGWECATENLTVETVMASIIVSVCSNTWAPRIFYWGGGWPETICNLCLILKIIL